MNTYNICPSTNKKIPIVINKEEKTNFICATQRGNLDLFGYAIGAMT